MTKKNLLYLIGLIVLSASFSSCATIIGGSNYYAKVQVPDHPDAKIEHKGSYKGTGEASFKAERRDADNFSITVKKEGCEDQTKTFTQKSFRGWAFTGSLLGFTGLVPGTFIPLPWGIAVDAATGAWWKPDINEIGVTKQDYNHYIYQIDYTGCDTKTERTIINKETTNSESKADKLRELKKLLDEGVITQEEFEKEKKKILNE